MIGMYELLPLIIRFHDEKASSNPVLKRVLDAMQEESDDIHDLILGLSDLLDPRVTNELCLFLLARFLGTDPGYSDFSLTLFNRREIVRNSIDLHKIKGTVLSWVRYLRSKSISVNVKELYKTIENEVSDYSTTQDLTHQLRAARVIFTSEGAYYDTESSGSTGPVIVPVTVYPDLLSAVGELLAPDILLSSTLHPSLFTAVSGLFDPDVLLGVVFEPSMLTASGTLNDPVVELGYTALAAKVTNEWKLNESSGNFVDSIAGKNLTVVNSPGNTTGLINGCRTFNGTQYGSLTDSSLSGAGQDISASVWFYQDTYSGYQQVICYRNAGSTDGNLHYILRTEAFDLKLYVGQGAGNNFSVWTIGSVLGLINTWQHFVFHINQSTGEVRYSWNNAAVVSVTSSYVPSNSTRTTAIGGEGAELWKGRIDEFKLGIGFLWTDVEFNLDYAGGSGWEVVP